MSKNKIILTSIVSIFVAMPAMAEFVNGQQIADQSGLLSGMSCNEDTLGTTSDPANIEAIWTPNTYNISYTCADGTSAMLALAQASQSMLGGSNNGVSATRAIYGENFTFAEGGCGEEGYHQTGWSCTRDNVANDTATVYTLGEELTPWDIPSDLTCTEVRVGNTITLNWYNLGQKQSETDCTYGTSNNEQGGLSLPSSPSPRQGYTFGGWRVFDICTTFDAQGTCNMNARCFWNGDANSGTCVSMNAAATNCDSAGNDQTQCQSYGYCRYRNECSFRGLVIYDFMQNEQQCLVHDGVWDSENQECNPEQHIL